MLDDAVYVPSDDGFLYRLDAGSGTERWRARVTEAPVERLPFDDPKSRFDRFGSEVAIAAGRFYVGTHDGHVVALEAQTASGSLLWKRDTGRPVVSTPAVAGQRVVVGSRSYDLLGLDAQAGEVAWKHYLWFSWVESSATLRDGIAYVGSSDGAIVAAHDAQIGRQLWATDV